MFGKKKPPVITEPKSFAAYDSPRAQSFNDAPRGGERDFSVDRDTKTPRAPWLTTGLLLGVTAALFGASIKYDYLLGQIVVPILGLTTLHGLFRGGFRKIIMLPATVLVVGFLATNPTVADPIVQKINGGPSVVGNWVACAVIAMVSLGLIAWPVKKIRNNVIMKRPVLRGTDRFFGTGIGFAEGAFTSLLVMWGTMLLEPQAQKIVDHPNAKACQQQFASGVIRLAAEIDASPLAPIIRDANLLEEIPAIKQQMDALQANGSFDASAIDPATRNSIIQFLESMDNEGLKAAAQSLRTIENNQEEKAEAYQRLPQPGNS